MKSSRLFILVVSASVIWASGASAFDCKKFLSQGGLGQLTDTKAYLVLGNGADIEPGRDLVNIDEDNKDRGRGVIADDEFKLDEPGNPDSILLKCRVSMVGFRPHRWSDEDLYLQSLIKKPSGPETKANVLLFQFRALSKDHAVPKDWSKKIPILISTGERQNKLTLDHSKFHRLNGTEGKTSPGQFVVLTALNSNAKDQLPRVWPGQESLAATALALCEPVDCKTLIARVNSSAHYYMPPPPSASVSQRSQSSKENKASAKGQSTKPDDDANSKLLTNKDRIESQANLMPPPSPALAGPVVLDGRDKAASSPLTDAATGGLACLLDMLAPELFHPHPECPLQAKEKWQGRKLQVQLNAKKEWIIVRREPPMPKRLEVLLPPGQDGLQCRLTATYVTREGAPKTITLEPSTKAPGKQPGRQARFEMKLDQAPQVEKKNEDDAFVNVRLEVSSEADCGTPGRVVDIPVRSEDLSVDLAPTSGGGTELVYVLLFNDIGHQLDEPGRPTLGSAMLESVLSAHRRASHFRSNEPWPLIGVRIGVLSSNGAVPLAQSSGTDLRTSGGRALATARRTAHGEFSDDGGLITLSSAGLANGLRKLAAPYAGIDRVVAVLIGPADRPGVLNELHDACNAELYKQARASIDDGSGPRLELVVFSIVWIDDFSRLKTVGLEPVDIIPGLPQLPGRIMHCTNSPEGIRIYPYLAEKWREPNENARRFGVAVSDRLGALIDEILSGKNQKVGKR